MSRDDIRHHWKKRRERASRWGIAILIALLRITGPAVVKWVVLPVSFYYFITSSDVRRYSQRYLSRVRNYAEKKRISTEVSRGPMLFLSFKHITSFAFSIVDRVQCWFLGSDYIRYEISGVTNMEDIFRSHGGMLFLVSHLGNFDLAIAKSDTVKDRKFNVVLDSRNTEIYREYRDAHFDTQQIRFISPNEITPIKAIDFVNDAKKGDVFVIAADRTVDEHDKNSVTVDFLGGKARFPMGPYILAHMLGVPVYTMFALKGEKTCLVTVELFEDIVKIDRARRENSIRNFAQKFARRLEIQCLNAPLQWYNFYDFWEESKTGNV